MPSDPRTSSPEKADAGADVRELAGEVIRQFLIWIADAPTMLERGLRASVALSCLRPDLLDGATLVRLGDDAGRGPGRVHQLAKEFRLVMGGTIGE